MRNKNSLFTKHRQLVFEALILLRELLTPTLGGAELVGQLGRTLE